MAWIESHQSIGNHPKLLKLCRTMHWSKADAVGRLHLFWHWCLDYAPDGQLEKHGREVVADVFGVGTDDCDKVITALHDAEFLDFEPQFRVHDWWDYAGRFLQVRYKRKPKIWKEIKRLYGHSVQRTNNRTATELSVIDNHKPNQPNQPNLTNHVRDRPCSERRHALEEFQLTDELRDWALTELRVQIPDDIFEEFKAYWKDQPDKQLRSNWTSTFKNRLRQLIGLGILRPIGPSGTAPPQVKCRGLNGPCEEYAVAGSSFCSKHRDSVRAIQKNKLGIVGQPNNQSASA